MTMNGNQGFGGTNLGHEPTKEELESQTDQVAPATEPTQETAPATPTDEVEVTQEHLDQYPELIEKGIELGQKVLKSVLDELEALKKDLSNSQPQG